MSDPKKPCESFGLRMGVRWGGYVPIYTVNFYIWCGDSFKPHMFLYAYVWPMMLILVKLLNQMSYIHMQHIVFSSSVLSPGVGSSLEMLTIFEGITPCDLPRFFPIEQQNAETRDLVAFHGFPDCHEDNPWIQPSGLATDHSPANTWSIDLAGSCDSIPNDSWCLGKLSHNLVSLHWTIFAIFS